MVNQFSLPTENEVEAVYTQHDAIGQVEAIPTVFMASAVMTWIVKYIKTEEIAKKYFDQIVEHYDPEGEVFQLTFEFNYRQSLVEIAKRKLLCNEDIFATILC